MPVACACARIVSAVVLAIDVASCRLAQTATGSYRGVWRQAKQRTSAYGYGYGASFACSPYSPTGHDHPTVCIFVLPSLKFGRCFDL